MAELGPVFVDTNVLVYATIEESPLHQTARRVLHKLHEEEIVCWISRQVIREFLVTLTRPDGFSPPLEMGRVLDLASNLERRFQVAEDGADVTHALHDLLGQTPVRGRRIHDANIVATMIANGIPTLLTHNIADFAPFSQLITVLRLEDAFRPPAV